MLLWEYDPDPAGEGESSRAKGKGELGSSGELLAYFKPGAESSIFVVRFRDEAKLLLKVLVWESKNSWLNVSNPRVCWLFCAKFPVH